MRLKKLVDELRDLGEKVSDEFLLSTLIAGLNEDFGNAASNIPLITNPTFPKIVAYLKLEERRMRMSRTRATHTALIAGTRGGAPPTAPAPPPRPAPSPFQVPPPPGFPYPAPPQAPPPPPAEQHQRRGGHRGRGGRKPQQQPLSAHGGTPRQPQQRLPPAPWQAGQNPRPRVFWRPPGPSSGSVRGPSVVSAGATPRPLGGLWAAFGRWVRGAAATAAAVAPWDPALLAALHTAPTS
nr:translation initiation factor IF-2-like [Aegilops tauschii subsp. strangulata]